jgi:hypothetical protein
MTVKRKAKKFLMIAAVALSLALTPLPGMAQQNNDTTKGQMK